VILYVNGDSNSAGAECTDNDKIWPVILAKKLECKLINEAKGGASNPRIMRVSSNALAKSDRNTIAVIGWTSWEREEWVYNNQYFDVNAGGHDVLPLALQERYKQWVINQGPEEQIRKSKSIHEQIHRLHRSLKDRRIPHLFFNALMPFQHKLEDPQHNNWNNNYLGPYNNNLSYYWYLKNQGWTPTDNNHYTEDAQAVWADILYNYIQENNLL